MNDQAVEAHQALVVVDGAGDVTWTQLAGRAPIDERPDRVDLGSTTIRVSSSPPSDGVATNQFGIVDRRPRRRAVSPSLRVAVTDAAVDFDHVLHRVHVAGREWLDAVVSEQRDHPTWARRASDGDAFVVPIGVGSYDLPITLIGDDGLPVDVGDLPIDVQAVVDAARRHDDVTITVDLAARNQELMAVSGVGAIAAVRAIATRLADRTGPADWQLVAVLDPAEHRWVERLPHLAGCAELDTRRALTPGDEADLDRLVDEIVSGSGADERRVIVLCDDPALVRRPGAALQRLRRSHRAVTVIVAVPADHQLPRNCTSVLRIGPRWRGSWSATAGECFGDIRLHVVGCALDTAIDVATRLADLIDPEVSARIAPMVPSVPSVPAASRSVDRRRCAVPGGMGLDPLPPDESGAISGGRSPSTVQPPGIGRGPPQPGSRR